MMTNEQLAKLIDHTLKAEASKDDTKRLYKETKKHGFWTLSIKPAYASLTTDAGVRESKTLY